MNPPQQWTKWEIAPRVQEQEEGITNIIAQHPKGYKDIKQA
jgi:hypothetical protein